MSTTEPPAPQTYADRQPADQELGSIARGSHRGRWIAGIVVAILVYAGLLVAYSLDGDTDEVSVPDPPAGGVSVTLILEKIDSATDRMTVKILAIADDDLLDDEGLPKEPVTLFLGPVVTGIDEISWATDRRIDQRETVLVLAGDIQSWPFDRYDSDAFSQAFVGANGSLREVPTTISVGGSTQGWHMHVEPSTLEAGGVAVSHVSLHRAVALIGFGLLLVAVLVTMAVLALFVSINTVRGRRRLEPDTLAWIAAMLFAVVPLREFLPGAPPAGSWVDIAVVLWVIVALVSSLVLVVTAWWRAGQARSAVEPPAPDTSRPAAPVATGPAGTGSHRPVPDPDR